MKGIVLSGGSGTRLRPLTKVTSKQLLPIYNKPMVFYPIHKLVNAGIKEILVIVAPDHCGDYMKVLGSGKDFGPGVRFTYEIQDKPEGLAQAFILAETFLDDGDNVTMILGDNLFDAEIGEAVQSFTGGANIFVKEVPESDRTRFGMVEFDAQMQVKSIEEKPAFPKSAYAQTGIYIYDNNVVSAAKSLQPSPRGELEITDLNNWYLQRGKLTASILEGEWIDAGTFESYHSANIWAYNKAQASAKTKAINEQQQLFQHTQYHAQLMLQLNELDNYAFTEITVRTPEHHEIPLLTTYPPAQELLRRLIEIRQMISVLHQRNKEQRNS